jgi:prevent-host-death family protein
MKITRDIQSVTEFKQNTAKFIKQVQETKEPLVLTVNGKAAVVIQDADSFEDQRGSNDYLETVRDLRLAVAGLDDAKNWPTATEVFAGLRSKVRVR